MPKPCQLAFIGAVAVVLTACSTTPPSPDGARADTRRVCVQQESSSGSRLSRRVCRTVAADEQDENKKAAPQD